MASFHTRWADPVVHLLLQKSSMFIHCTYKLPRKMHFFDFITYFRQNVLNLAGQVFSVQNYLIYSKNTLAYLLTNLAKYLSILPPTAQTNRTRFYEQNFQKKLCKNSFSKALWLAEKSKDPFGQLKISENVSRKICLSVSKNKVQ